MLNNICHLCGREISSNIDRGNEHIPPKQFFPKKLRKMINPNLVKIPAHKSCNASYQKDETYFYHLGLFAQEVPGNVCGSIIFDDIKKRTEEHDGDLHVIQRVFKQFSPIHLPGNRRAFRPEVDRIKRVAWKITRGLFFINTNGRFLPENQYRTDLIMFNVLQKDRIPDIYKKMFSVGIPVGDHPMVFFEKTIQVEKTWVCTFYLWDFWLFSYSFHDPQCNCDDCINANSSMNIITSNYLDSSPNDTIHISDKKRIETQEINS